MATEVTRAYDAGDDKLIVEGSIDGADVRAYGWLSALENHFDADAHATLRDDNGDEHPELGPQRSAEAEPRAMTADERRAYCVRLLEEQNPRPDGGGREIELT